MSRYVIAGAPCSGKSSYVRENAKAGDLIYDYDALHQALSGQDAHRHLTEIRPYVLTARDAIYEDLEAHGEQAAWLISSSRKTEELEALGERFGAEIVLMEVDAEEAHRRATADGRPEEWHGYIDAWFAESDIGAGVKCRRKSMTIKRKTFTAPMRLKAEGDGGEFTAVFSTFNVVDHDGDVTIAGAFEEQEVIIEPWNHSWNLPAGKGTIKSDEEKAWVEGQFFLDTEAGRENYQTVKNLGVLQEWSYTFNILEKEEGVQNDQGVTFLRKLDVVGVSPVTRGAGIGTRTVDIKQDKTDGGEDEAGKGKSSGADPKKPGGGEDEAGDGKSSGADLMTTINIFEAELIKLKMELANQGGSENA